MWKSSFLDSNFIWELDKRQQNCPKCHILTEFVIQKKKKKMYLELSQPYKLYCRDM